MVAVIGFVRKLKKNNNKAWFDANRASYEVAKKEIEDLAAAIISSFGKTEPAIAHLTPKDCLFRINRDVRFSKDKSPYKTNFGAGLGMGKGNRIAGYYLHIEPGKSFLAGGVYQPESSVLKEIRKEISMNGKAFLKIIEKDDFRNNFRGLSVENKLQKVPQGFEKDDPMAEYLKLKSFIVFHPVSDSDLTNEKAVKNFAIIYKSIQPLNDFLEAPFR